MDLFRKTPFDGSKQRRLKREGASLKTQNPFPRLPASLVRTLLSWEANAGSDLLRAMGWAVTERMPQAHDHQFGQKDTQKAAHL